MFLWAFGVLHGDLNLDQISGQRTLYDPFITGCFSVNHVHLGFG